LPKSLRKKRLRPLSTNGASLASLSVREHGSFRRRDTRPSTASGTMQRSRKKLESYAASELVRTVEEPDYDTSEIPDDRLRLIFTCCHPAFALEAQVALTLRTLCGPDTDEIVRAFLVPEATTAQRLVRAKRKIRDVGIHARCTRRTTWPPGSKRSLSSAGCGRFNLSSCKPCFKSSREKRIVGSQGSWVPARRFSYRESTMQLKATLQCAKSVKRIV
jgi:hypothetical protein